MTLILLLFCLKNQGTAFSMTERDRLDLRGLLPPNVMTSPQQIERFSKFVLPFSSSDRNSCQKRKKLGSEQLIRFRLFQFNILL